jgi:hypothetical protein
MSKSAYQRLMKQLAKAKKQPVPRMAACLRKMQAELERKDELTAEEYEKLEKELLKLLEELEKRYGLFRDGVLLPREGGAAGVASQIALRWDGPGTAPSDT